MNIYEKFVHEAYGSKVDGLPVTDTVKAVIKEEAKKVSGHTGNVGRLVLEFGCISGAAETLDRPCHYVRHIYRDFIRQMRKHEHANPVLEALWA